MNALVTYFSASGITAKLAHRLAEAIGSPIYEIKPAVPYARADLDWTNQQSRSTLEMHDKSCRPALADTDAPVQDADIIFVGYPVWWYREPSIIDSFLASYDFSGKKIVLFATSGGSDIGTEAITRGSGDHPGNGTGWKALLRLCNKGRIEKLGRAVIISSLKKASCFQNLWCKDAFSSVLHGHLRRFWENASICVDP